MILTGALISLLLVGCSVTFGSAATSSSPVVVTATFDPASCYAYNGPGTVGQRDTWVLLDANSQRIVATGTWSSAQVVFRVRTALPAFYEVDTPNGGDLNLGESWGPFASNITHPTLAC